MRRTAIIAGGGLASLVVVAVVLGLAFRGGERGAVPGDTSPAAPIFVALDDGPPVVIEVRAEGTAIARRAASERAGAWSTELPAGAATYGWSWAHHGAVVVGAMHREEPAGSIVVALRVADGRLLGTRPVDRELFGAAGDGRFIVRGPSSVSLIDTEGDELTTIWEAELVAGDMLPTVGMSSRRVVVFDGELHVLDRVGGEELEPPDAPQDLLGLIVEREELLVRVGDRVAVRSLDGGGGTEDRATDLNGVVHGPGVPCLLGGHMGKWIVLYATTPSELRSEPGQPTHAIPGAHHVAAIDAATGAVAWTLDLGPWDVDCAPLAGRMAVDSPLPRRALLHGLQDVDGGAATRGWLGLVDVAHGRVDWHVEYDGALRANPIWRCLRDVCFLAVAHPADDLSRVLVRFESGTLTGAVRLAGHAVWAPALGRDAVYVSDPERRGIRLVGPGLTPEPIEDGEATAPEDAASWAATELGLPEAAVAEGISTSGG